MKPNYIAGNIYKNELDDIINGDIFQNIHEGFLCNEKRYELCKKCSFYDNRKGDYLWTK